MPGAAFVSPPLFVLVVLNGPTNAWVVIFGETYIPNRSDCFCDGIGVYTALLLPLADLTISRNLSTRNVSREPL